MSDYDKRSGYINFVNIPLDGDTIIDLDGKRWTYRNSLPFGEGIHLEDKNKANHPGVVGMQSWMEFASWFNEKV